MPQVADPYPPSGLLKRFTLPARLAVARGKDEARSRHHGRVGTEHLLLALIHEADSVTGQVLEQLGVLPRVVRSRVEQFLRYHDQRVLRYPDERPPPGAIFFTTRSKRALRLALQESVVLGDRYLGSGHILVGLIREGEGEAARVLLELGADAGRVQAQLCRFYGRRADSDQ